MATRPWEWEEQKLSRRDVLTYAWWGLALLLAGEGAGATVASLWPRVEEGTFGGKFTIPLNGLPKEIGAVDATYLSTGRFYLTRTRSGLLALYRKCTHLGCVVPWRPDEASEDELARTGRFNCPCHASIFDRYGLVRGGPAPRPLDIFPASVVDGKLVVDTGKIIERSDFDPSQPAKV